MYLTFKDVRIGKIHRGSKQFPNIQLNICGLRKDDGTFIKHIEMTESVVKKLDGLKIDITFPEIEYALKEHDVEKIIPREDIAPVTLKDLMEAKKKIKKGLAI